MTYSSWNIKYEKAKILVNYMFLKVDPVFEETQMNLLDRFLSKKLNENRAAYKKDFHSILHIILNVFKQTPRPAIRQCLRLTIEELLNGMKELDPTHFALLAMNATEMLQF